MWYNPAQVSNPKEAVFRALVTGGFVCAGSTTATES
jgi:hypothetical protein